MVKAPPRLGAIVLAAGESKRMGILNKLLLPIQGKSMVRRTTELALSIQPKRVVVVTGHQSEFVEEELSGLQVEVVFNPDYEKGMMTSLQKGVRVLDDSVDGYMVFLSDLPFVQTETLRLLQRRFEAMSAPSLIAPSHNGMRGHPVILSAHYRQEILDRQILLEKGAGFLFYRHSQCVHTVEVSTPSVRHDIDTFQEYSLMSPL